MRVLYVSDLDGTLLRSNETISEYTNNVINRLTDEGMIFSYAKVNNNPHITKFQPHLFLHIWGYFMIFVENYKSKQNTIKP